MNDIIEKRYCTKCKTTDDLMPRPYSVTAPAKRSGLRIGYFMCNTCNTARCQRYRSTSAGAGRVYRANQRSIAKYPHKQLARKRLLYALKMGRVVRPSTCDWCEVKTKPDAHHPDYNFPLEVLWLCRKCHIRHHHDMRNTLTTDGARVLVKEEAVTVAA